MLILISKHKAISNTGTGYINYDVRESYKTGHLNSTALYFSNKEVVVGSLCST